MPVFESKRKVQVFGSSLAMTLPAMFVKVNEVEKGSNVKVLYSLDGVLIACLKDDVEDIMKSLNNMIDKIEEKIQNKKLSQKKSTERV
jgi:antitoxin component of MazEF toxin-antitoxin module